MRTRVLEPSTSQEIKDWIGVAFELSEKSRLYMAYLVTSNQADGGGTVALRARGRVADHGRPRSRIDHRRRDP